MTYPTYVSLNGMTGATTKKTKHLFPFNKEGLGRILGPARGEGNEMAQWVLKPNGRVVPRRTSRPLNTAEINSETENKKREISNALIKGKLETSINAPEDELQDFEQYKWYDWCYYKENKGPFPFNKEVLGKILGPARGEGNEI